MSRVIIVANAHLNHQGEVVASSPSADRMVSAFTQAIAATGHDYQVVSPLITKNFTLRSDDILCPLTLQLPKLADNFEFEEQALFQNCQRIHELRHWVQTQLGMWVLQDEQQLGTFWLPIVCTSKGNLYGEVIEEDFMPNSYRQPLDLPDVIRQPLYNLGYQLLQHLEAKRGVYLLQFQIHTKQVVFDRLWPFPAAPAIASIGIQQPDLYTCHWHCILDKPIQELFIPSSCVITPSTV
ncbi:MAG: hypothetical protein HC796_04185 [Synechococcaceae cyanobacterium RL_1_2]|nr:hypothetical protein [Synechococcaceae cyanobacterium RL_1_2]